MTDLQLVQPQCYHVSPASHKRQQYFSARYAETKQHSEVDMLVSWAPDKNILKGEKNSNICRVTEVGSVRSKKQIFFFRS
jgi:hypothetical protein